MGIVGKIASGIIVTVIVVGIFVGIGQLMVSSVDVGQTEVYIFQYINEERANRNLPTLGNDSSLTNISTEWSNHLSSINDLTHGDFDGRMRSIGLPNTQYSCGEIIGSYVSGSTNGIPDKNSPQEIAREFVNMWLNSPPHREIMLTASGGYMGVGMSRYRSVFYGVVDFKFS